MFAQAEAHAHWPHGLRGSHSANGVKCVYVAQVPKALATVAPLPRWLPANWAGSSVGQKKTINCVAQVEKKKQRRINERQKTKNSRNIFLKGERGTARATECAGNQYATKAICQRPRPNAHCAYLAHLLPAHWRCMHCGTVARWHGELSWTELWLSWIYGRRRTKVGNGNCLK